MKHFLLLIISTFLFANLERNGILAQPKLKIPIAIVTNPKNLIANTKESEDLSLLPDFEGCFCGCPVQNKGRSKRIIGGSFVDDGGIYYQVGITCEDCNPWGPICGGVIINSKTVITAGHCCDAIRQKICNDCYIRYNTNKICMNLAQIYQELRNPPKLSCRPDIKSILEQPVLFQEKIEKFIIHPEYNDTTVANDICVVHVKNEMQLNVEPNYADSIDIADCEPHDYTKLQVSGWGLQNMTDHFQPSCLKKLNVRVYNRQECKWIYGILIGVENPEDTINRVDNSMICAIGSFGQDFCSGDSGGPLVYIDPTNCKNIKLVGLVSKGYCGYFPGTYTSAVYLKDFVMKNKV